MSQVDYYIIAGEMSGDLHGAKLISAMLAKNPNLKIAAVAGPQMRSFPIQSPFAIENLSVMGFIDVFFALPKIVRQFFAIRNSILKTKPKAVIFIDYPGFNLRLQNSLRKKKFTGKLIHYICPSVWAWGKKRIPLMEKNLDLLITLFPFEKEYFSKKLRVEHVGHPLISAIAKNQNQRTNTLALFPGSRTKEITKNLPLQIAVAKQLQKEDPTLKIAISISHPEKESLIKEIAKTTECLFVPPENTYHLMKTAKLALAKSGTVTLELALHETPTIVNFAIRPLDVFIAQKIFKINLPFYCIVNILARKEIFPEFIGPHCTFENLIHAARNVSKQNVTQVRDLLTSKNASEEAAFLILNL